MATIEYALGTSLTDFTVTGDPAEGTVSVSSGEWLTNRPSNGTAPLGFVKTTGVAGADGQAIYWAFRFSNVAGGWGNFPGLFNDSATVAVTGGAHSCGIYVDAGVFITWRGNSTLNSAFTYAVDTQYWGKAAVNSDGTITFSYSDTSILGPWNALSSSIVAQSFDATASTIHFIGCIPWSGSTNIWVDNYFYTDDGSIAPPAPQNLTATALDAHTVHLEWDQAGLTTTNCTGIGIWQDGVPVLHISYNGDPTGAWDVEGLDADTEYDFWVVAEFYIVGVDDFESDPSNTETVTTPAEPVGDDTSGEAMLVMGDLS